jgi:hypothetical protein
MMAPAVDSIAARSAAARRPPPPGAAPWDGGAQASRPGSLDSNTGDRNANDLLGRLGSYAHMATIVCNGGTAKRLGLRGPDERAARYRRVELASSSPADSIPYAGKPQRWAAPRPAPGAFRAALGGGHGGDLGARGTG